jgi:aryl-alcohol dehydrogenase-like predicted oxidoreductase
VPIEEVVWTMNTLIQQGKILYWGTSEWSGVEIMEAHRVARDNRLIGPSMEQPQYNLFERHKMENDYLEVFKNVGLGTTIWSPLASGLLTGKYNNGIPDGSRISLPGFEWLKDSVYVESKIEKVKKLGELANELGQSLAAIAIAWTLKNPNVSTTILGATSEQQLVQNLQALDALPLLTEEVMTKIESIMETKPILPQW